MTINHLHEHLNLEAILKTDERPFKKSLPMPLSGANRVVFTAYGRNAIYLGLKEIANLTKKREVLVPSYSCGDEINAIVSAGFKVKPYAIHKDLSFNLEEIRALSSAKTAAILVTHFFGFPDENLEKLVAFCQKDNLLLIEDCAHALGGKLRNKYLGTFGDISIFSLRKFYPIPHGGALVINNKKIESPKVLDISSPAVEKDFSVFLGFRSGILKPGIGIISQPKAKINRHGARLEEFGGYRLGMSNSTKFFISSLPKPIATKRLKRFKTLLKFFSESNKLAPLISEIDNNVNPLFFPLLVKNSEKIADLVNTSKLVFAQPFWSYKHQFVDWNIFPETNYLKGNILVLPLHEDIDTNLLYKILKVV